MKIIPSTCRDVHSYLRLETVHVLPAGKRRCVTEAAAHAGVSTPLDQPAAGEATALQEARENAVEVFPITHHSPPKMQEFCECHERRSMQLLHQHPHARTDWLGISASRLGLWPLVCCIHNHILQLPVPSGCQYAFALHLSCYVTLLFRVLFQLVEFSRHRLLRC